MDRELREDIRRGVDHMDDAEAAEQAHRLETALDRIPELLDRIHRASSRPSVRPVPDVPVPDRRIGVEVTMKELLEAGAHFGHRIQHPKMKPYIFSKRNGIYILDLQKTLKLFEQVIEFVKGLASQGKRILFVGTKRQAQEAIAEEARRCGEFYVTNRWLGGTLTNFVTLRASIQRLKETEARLADENSPLTKKERLRLERERDKMVKSLDGIRDMEELPDAVFVIDSKKEAQAVSEANHLGIPVIAVVATNCDPELIDYIIPGNDKAIRAIRLFSSRIAEAYLAGLGKTEEKMTIAVRETSPAHADRAAAHRF
jgi:small subunit ribosomal protein S2